MTVAAVLLAAGASERMGRPKALLKIGETPAIDVVVAALHAAGCAPIVAVVGRHAAEITTGAELRDCTVVEHTGWAAGRTSSIRAGLAALPQGAEAAVLGLVDMPLVRAETVTALIAAWRGAGGAPDVVVPRHRGRGGHPIVLARRLFPEIAALGDNVPLRDLLRSRRRLDVDVDDPGVLVDLDTPEDLRHLPPT